MITMDEMRALLGKQVVVTLQREDPPESAVVARGQLLKIADSGEFVVMDDGGFCHYCWPALDMREAECTCIDVTNLDEVGPSLIPGDTPCPVHHPDGTLPS